MEVCLPIVWGGDWRDKNKMNINHAKASGSRRTKRVRNNQLKICFNAEEEYGQDVRPGRSACFFIAFGEQ